MSTITILNPLVRQLRAARRAVRIQFDKLQNIATVFGRLVIDTFMRLDALRKRPTRDGFAKEKLHNAILKRFETAAEAMPA